jgi:hypothetical protein
MRKTLTMLAVLVLSAFLCTSAWAQNAPAGVGASTQAVIPLVDPVGFTHGNSTSDCVNPTDAALGVDSYSLTLTAPKEVTIGAADCCCIGDYYRTFVNGVTFNTTPNPFDYCAAGTDPWGCLTGTCTPLSSGSSTACLPAGTYSVNVKSLTFVGHAAAEIAAELMCPNAWTDSISTAPVADCSCGERQAGVILLMPDESSFGNHGKYVSAAVATLDSMGAVSEECHSCIVNQFARSVPQDAMTSCGAL